jgi:hypothetical protein
LYTSSFLFLSLLGRIATFNRFAAWRWRSLIL